MRALLRLLACVAGVMLATSAFAQQPMTPRGEQFRYVGCYKDTSDFDLNGHLERGPQNTPQRCIAICRDKGFRYAGVQYGESCLCGNSYGKYGVADNCNMKCTGGPMTCGGYSANEVFETN